MGTLAVPCVADRGGWGERLARGIWLGLALTWAAVPAALAAPAIVQEVVDRSPNATVRSGIRACPTGYAMSGLHADNDELLCLRMQRSGYTLGPAVRDAGMTVSNQFPGGRVALVSVVSAGATLVRAYSGPSFHFCGDRRVMVGVDLRSNAFLCAEWSRPGDAALAGSALAYRLDLPPRATVRAAMHACEPGEAMMGVHADENIFLCGTIYASPPPFVPGDRVVGAWPALCAQPEVRMYYGDSSYFTRVARGQTDRSAFIAPGSGSAQAIRWQCRSPQGQATTALILCPAAANIVQLTRSVRSDDPQVAVKCTERNPLY